MLVYGTDGAGVNPADVAAIKSLKDAIAKLQAKVTALKRKKIKIQSLTLSL